MRDVIRALAIAVGAAVLVVSFYSTVFWWQKLTNRAAEAEQAKINAQYQGRTDTAAYRAATADLWKDK